VALVINPVLTSMYMKVESKKTPLKKALIRSAIAGGIGVVILISGLNFHKKGLVGLGNLAILFAILNLTFSLVLNKVIDWFQNSLLPSLERGYEKVLRYALKGRRVYTFFFLTFALLIFSMFLMKLFPPKILFFPESDPEQIFVYTEFPIGTDIEKTNKLTNELEIKIQDYLKKTEKEFMVKSVIGQVGEGTGDPEQGDQGNTPNKSRITLDFVEFVNRKGLKTSDILTDLRKLLVDFPGANVTIAKKRNGPPAGPPLNIEVTGDDYDELIITASEIKDFINSKNVSGIEELKLDVELGKPEMIVHVDRQKANRLGTSTGQVADLLRTALYGKEISTYKDGEDNYPINIRLQEKYRNNKEALLNQKIIFRDQSSGRIKQIPLGAISSTENKTTFSAVKRRDLNRVISIYTNILEGYNATEVVENTKHILKSYKIKRGYSFEFTGEQEEQAKQMAFLSKALLIAVMLIFLILVAQFNSAVTPVIISLSVLLSLIGVLLGLIGFNMDFIVLMTMLGVISLAGIVVNNAIVLIDYVNLIIERKKAKLNIDNDKLLPKQLIFESIVEAGKVRLRPVLLTAITTILGLIPLAFGININFVTLFTEFDAHFYIGGENVMFWGPLSKTVIFGLTFATFLTLIIVPVMYYILFRIQIRFNKDKIANV
jgi:multidrug efflux pump subunit AcrB